MSATATEPVSVPLYLQAVGAILRLAHVLFYRIEMTEGLLDEREFSAWKTLRKVARLLCERCAMELSMEEAYELRYAMKFCPPSEDYDWLFAQKFTERG